jgi:pimeloyl-ACP methyl ester carboxylesterase
VSNHPYRGLVGSFNIAAFYLLQQTISHSRLLTAAVNELWSRSRSDNRRLYKLGGRSFTLAARNGRGYDSKKIWATINAPVYAVFGGSDKLVTAIDMETLREILPDAKTTVIPGAGHSLLVTHPEAVARALFADLHY